MFKITRLSVSGIEITNVSISGIHRRNTSHTTDYVVTRNQGMKELSHDLCYTTSREKAEQIYNDECERVMQLLIEASHAGMHAEMKTEG